MEIFSKFVVLIAMVVIFALLMSLPTMWLWNWLMPLLFGLIKINIWEALGLNLLCVILFKSNNTNIPKK